MSDPTECSMSVQSAIADTVDPLPPSQPDVAHARWTNNDNRLSLYTSNIQKETESSEAVDRDSIAEISITRELWEKVLDPVTCESQRIAVAIKALPRWQVRVPYCKPFSETSISGNKPSVEDLASHNEMENAIASDILLSVERERLVKEDHERIQFFAGTRDVRSPSMCSSSESGELLPGNYNELAESDRGAQFYEQNCATNQENPKRDEALQRNISRKKPIVSHIAVKKYENIIEKEIQLQQEREQELNEHRTQETAFSKKSTNSIDHHPNLSLSADTDESKEQELKNKQCDINIKRHAENNMIEEIQNRHEQKTDHFNSRQSDGACQPTFSKNNLPAMYSEDQSLSENEGEHARQETPIEREIRLVHERENELRRRKGLPELSILEGKEKSTVLGAHVDKKEANTKESIKRKDVTSQNFDANIRRFASCRIKGETKVKEKRGVMPSDRSPLITAGDSVKPTRCASIVGDTALGQMACKTNRSLLRRQCSLSSQESSTLIADSDMFDGDGYLENQSPNDFGETRSGNKILTTAFSFSYSESAQSAESAIGKELQEMKLREEELRHQRVSKK